MLEEFYHAVRNPVIPADTELLPRADIAFIFGNKYITAELADKAARLYHSGYVSKILVTGGVYADNGLTEAQSLQKTLVADGVPGQDILVENKSGNTEENIQFGKKLIDREIGLQNINTVISLGHAKAGPRFLMTLFKHWPSALPMHVSVFPQGITADNWRENPEFMREVFNEAGKLDGYRRRNYLAPVLPRDINKIIAAYPDFQPPMLRAA